MWFTCPKCDYESMDQAEWEVRFCPSTPDKCEGCEVDESKWRCPDCGHEGPRHPRDPRDQWDTLEEWRGER